MALRDIDFPTGHSFPRNHPKRLLLTSLIEQNAAEYAQAAKSEGFHSPDDGVYIRCKSEIITTVIQQLMTEGGQYMIKKKGDWVVNEEYNNNEDKVRIMVSERFKVQIEKWRAKRPGLPPLPETGVPSISPQEVFSSLNEKVHDTTSINTDAPQQEAKTISSASISAAAANSERRELAPVVVQSTPITLPEHHNRRTTEVETNDVVEALLQMKDKGTTSTTIERQPPTKKQRLSSTSHHTTSLID